MGFFHVAPMTIPADSRETKNRETMGAKTAARFFFTSGETPRSRPTPGALNAAHTLRVRHRRIHGWRGRTRRSHKSFVARSGHRLRLFAVPPECACPIHPRGARTALGDLPPGPAILERFLHHKMTLRRATEPGCWQERKCGHPYRIPRSKS